MLIVDEEKGYGNWKISLSIIGKFVRQTPSKRKFNNNLKIL